MHKLSAVRICPITDGDEYSPNSNHGSQGKDFEVWANDILSLVEDINNDKINMKSTPKEVRLYFVRLKIIRNKND